ncbi:MAG: PQQ-dependent sugar dehydrogenase [Methyloceanibacter sp.]|uniref:PQQ-dependent sugar dehydrogenase n=1 Tax=Methyloceanibacter sp. TaxID=1965321 RepID=UPI003D9AFC35
MKRRVLSAFVCVLAAPAMLFAAPARSECLPPFTETIGTEPDPALILAEGSAPIAVRIAGPFDVPWSVAALPDGAFLVTERPGRLKLVQPGAETHEIFGLPPVYYSDMADCSM